MNKEFREAVADVEPLVDEPRKRVLPRRPPAPLPRQTRRDEKAALAESLSGPVSVDDALDTGEEMSFVREGYPRSTLRRLRRGHWTVEASLDLHGMNRAEAQGAVREFLRRCVARGYGCVRIVHGRGLGSPNREPVLKAKLRKWLPLRAEVLAFSQAPRAHGGSGAALVLLRGA
ncbi:MAG TPA: Smr/MutS family protein [Burkholderiales bacterium]|nr:Smr/MutS family protein [Burkholderiales bacterium]